MTKNISPQNASELLLSGEAILIDVREADEFAGEHITHALSIPLSVFEHEFPKLKIDTKKKLIFQCLKGQRSKQACAIASSLDDLNHDILNIEGGLSAWKESELHTIKHASSSGLSIFRQVQIIVGGLIALSVLFGFSGGNLGFILAALFGSALCFAGITGWCGLAKILHLMPWNKGQK